MLFIIIDDYILVLALLLIEFFFQVSNQWLSRLALPICKYSIHSEMHFSIANSVESTVSFHIKVHVFLLTIKLLSVVKTACLMKCDWIAVITQTPLYRKRSLAIIIRVCEKLVNYSRKTIKSLLKGTIMAYFVHNK